MYSKDRRRLLWLGATAHPTAEWIAQQLTRACGWDRCRVPSMSSTAYSAVRSGVDCITDMSEHEIADCGRRRIERHLAEARLPVDKTLASFDFDVVPMVSKAQVMAIAAGDSWLEKGAFNGANALGAPRYFFDRVP